MTERVKNTRTKYRLWKSERQYRKIVKRVQAKNSCPKCNKTEPHVDRIYRSTDPKLPEEDRGIWIAAMICTRYGCNTTWSAPQTLSMLLD